VVGLTSTSTQRSPSQASVLNIFRHLAGATGVMVAIGIRRRKAVIGPNKLLRVFYRDGIFYFISLFGVSLPTTPISFEGADGLRQSLPC
jgi:hypothetical protein